MNAKDIMTTPVVSVAPDTSVEEIVRILWDHRISGVPVVDAAGRLIGLVSEDDLMRREENGTERSSASWSLRSGDAAALALSFTKAHGHLARDVMSSPVVSIAEETALDEVATLLERHRIKRVVVVRERQAVGIVSRSDLLRGLVPEAQTAPTVQVDDQAIKRAILKVVNRQPWVTHGCLNVVVNFGEVELWGWVDSKEEHHAIRVAVEGVPGVSEIKDHLAMVPPYLRGDAA